MTVGQFIASKGLVMSMCLKWHLNGEPCRGNEEIKVGDVIDVGRKYTVTEEDLK
jgi:hypothetical protein